MVDLETHKIVDMIESREMEDIKRWLMEYPNLRVVSRDGSNTYASAITAAHPGALQISDRFHLIKNLTERATVVFQKLFQGRIGIPVTAETQGVRTSMLIGTKAERIRIVKDFYSEGRSKNEISLLTGVSLKTIVQYIDTPQSKIPEHHQTVRGREHEDALVL